jgi:Gas vesicle synthesis protein GvpL/GvpF
VDPFRAAVAELQRSHADLGFLLTGPWPPYSFTGP